MEVINKIEEDCILNNLIKDKRVCLCGPATTNIGTNYGNYIDNCDTVCRINWHLTGTNGWDDKYINDFGDIVKHVQQTARDGDLIVVMGAGPVTNIAHSLTNSTQVSS